ncbi:MAG: hypothetical protein OXR67_04635, partial [Chloroflexota bacterium]|nr:hypothetical protein [Chloroflexota bacterium]
PVCTVTDCQAELEVTVLQKARCPNCGELISRYGCHPKHGCRCSGADCDRPALENLYQCAECIIDRYRPDTPN